MKDEEQAEANAALDDARRFLEEAISLERAGFPGPSLRSSYYAMFNAARALLLIKGIKARTHKGAFPNSIVHMSTKTSYPMSWAETFRVHCPIG